MQVNYLVLLIAALFAAAGAVSFWISRRARGRLLQRMAAHHRQHIEGLNTLYGELQCLKFRLDETPAPLATLEITHQDFALSPFTGMSRDSWREVGRTLLSGALYYTDGMRGPLRFPPSAAAGYPRIHESGKVYGKREAYLEAYARTLLLATALLKDEPDMELYGRRVVDYYREYLLRGVCRSDPASFGSGGWGAPLRPHQRIVEAAMLALCLKTAPEALWSPLSKTERARVAAWLGEVKDLHIGTLNWLWFNVIVNTFLKCEGHSYNAQLVESNLQRIRGMHRDAGWFIDGDKFDYYSAWALQFYPLFWCAWDGDAHPALREEFYRRNDQFLQTYPHLFSRRGHMPLWGRSVCYRFAASAPLAVAFFRPAPPALDPGFARRLCSGNMLQFVQHPAFLRNGIPSLGFYGEEGSLIDDYSCTASPLWCAKLFLALALPAESPFWTARENEGFWSNPPAAVAFGSTGLRIEHDPATGHSRLYAPQTARPDDPRYAAPFFDTADVEY